MSRQVFLLAILDPQTRQVVEIPAGGKLERDFVAAVAEALAAKGVGVRVGYLLVPANRLIRALCWLSGTPPDEGRVLTTAAAVTAAITAAIAGVLTDFKNQTVPLAR